MLHITEPAPMTHPPVTSTRPATAAALTATLGLAALAWLLTVRQMGGMDMGVATPLGPFAPFVAFWAVMMAAMMLPAAVPAVLQRARADGRIPAVLLFVGSYLLVWTLFGTLVFVVYRPHGTVAAGLLVIGAGVYEFTRVKRECRRRCRERAGSGLTFGLACAGSSIGLMVMLVALGVMSIPWMILIALLVLAQKLFPARAAVDVPVALAIVALGVLILIAPSSVPGIMPSMSSM